MRTPGTATVGLGLLLLHVVGREGTHVFLSAFEVSKETCAAIR